MGKRYVSGAEREGKGARRLLQPTYSRAGLFESLPHRSERSAAQGLRLPAALQLPGGTCPQRPLRALGKLLVLGARQHRALERSAGRLRQDALHHLQSGVVLSGRGLEAVARSLLTAEADRRRGARGRRQHPRSSPRVPARHVPRESASDRRRHVPRESASDRRDRLSPVFLLAGSGSGPRLNSSRLFPACRGAHRGAKPGVGPLPGLSHSSDPPRGSAAQETCRPCRM